MRQFFVPTALLQEDEVPLEGEVHHHLATVLRLKPGEEVLLLDGQGMLCRCRIERLERRSGRALVLERWREGEKVFPIQLLQALPKGDKLELVLQKGTELGITRFTPVEAERSVALVQGDRGEKRLQRWERIVLEAARQSRRPLLPRLEPPLPLSEALAACRAELRLMLWEQESRPLAAVLPPTPPRDAAILVGPEGGFSPAEAQTARAAGFLPVGLGPRILRSETAGFAVASILQFIYGDLGAAPGKT
ncbi:ribosomal RNA small subunit methyltransferase E [Desulfuromonas versatilis]|uniref:Ribosomal RNA small subunit methyltransferase E n=1 Tax=Desulfuromonas versatilis TaxID=2802975 RepID=A0ABN6DTR2_9BACT|nr:16S rRNA (uracil(1498)-N(3))-methyltransferase [Desulfuromonas versatilis]BCR03512.1 ribosomal RNA small subunit methyltransferase E [Desulfuromonas versatilis]